MRYNIKGLKRKERQIYVRKEREIGNTRENFERQEHAVMRREMSMTKKRAAKGTVQNSTIQCTTYVVK
jgi:hypothetical protein